MFFAMECDQKGQKFGKKVMCRDFDPISNRSRVVGHHIKPISNRSKVVVRHFKPVANGSETAGDDIQQAYLNRPFSLGHYDASLPSTGPVPKGKQPYGDGEPVSKNKSLTFKSFLLCTKN